MRCSWNKDSNHHSIPFKMLHKMPHFPPPPPGPPPPNINIIDATPSASSVASPTAYQPISQPAYHPNIDSSIPEESGPPLPTRPAQGVVQSTYQPPQQDSTPKTCPRCSYNNHADMTNCEMCEAPLQQAAGEYPGCIVPTTASATPYSSWWVPEYSLPSTSTASISGIRSRSKYHGLCAATSARVSRLWRRRPV